MNITFVISSMGSGGAERVMATLANYWQQQGRSITLLTLDNSRERSFYPLVDGIRHRQLGVASLSTNPLTGIANNVNRLSVLRRAIRASQPDVVISFGDKTNIRTLLALTGLAVPVLVAERSAPGAQKLGRVWEKLRQLTYRRADHIVVQSRGAQTYFTPALQAKMSIIPNPVPPPPVRRTQPLGAAGKKICAAMGRLSAEKGFDRLLQAFATLAPNFPEWSLMLIGDGPLRTELMTLARQLGVEQRVDFTGRLKDPFAQLVQAELFVMSSVYEGFPNALCEAMACGLPVISFDCPDGPREIIRHEVDGLLVPAADVTALAAAMTRVMTDGTLRQQLAEHASDVLVRFSLKQVMALWETALIAGIERKAR